MDLTPRWSSAPRHQRPVALPDPHAFYAFLIARDQFDVVARISPTPVLAMQGDAEPQSGVVRLPDPAYSLGPVSDDPGVVSQGLVVVRRT